MSADSSSVSSPTAPTKRDWPEDFAHENGLYLCLCMWCHESFFGHKRRVECKECTALCRCGHAKASHMGSCDHSRRSCEEIGCLGPGSCEGSGTCRCPAFNPVGGPSGDSPTTPPPFEREHMGSPSAGYPGPSSGEPPTRAELIPCDECPATIYFDPVTSRYRNTDGTRHECDGSGVAGGEAGTTATPLTAESVVDQILAGIGDNALAKMACWGPRPCDHPRTEHVEALRGLFLAACDGLTLIPEAMTVRPQSMSYVKPSELERRLLSQPPAPASPDKGLCSRCFTENIELFDVSERKIQELRAECERLSLELAKVRKETPELFRKAHLDEFLAAARDRVEALPLAGVGAHEFRAAVLEALKPSQDHG